MPTGNLKSSNILQIDQNTFENAILQINEIFLEAESMSARACMESCCACMTAYLLYLCMDTFYEKVSNEWVGSQPISIMDFCACLLCVRCCLGKIFPNPQTNNSIMHTSRSRNGESHRKWWPLCVCSKNDRFLLCDRKSFYIVSNCDHEQTCTSHFFFFLWRSEKLWAISRHLFSLRNGAMRWSFLLRQNVTVLYLLFYKRLPYSAHVHVYSQFWRLRSKNNFC